ncbi:MAG: tetratricopeptide repeat protein [Verrucomicrobia bacterium]|nr:tetratricopeptide repeat protein [Verrucomicrobiota bacterium]
MQDKQHLPYGFVQSVVPWIVAGGAFVVYALTLNHWVSLDSLPYVAKVTGWDWVPPLQAPLFFLLTHPIRWLPSASQPIALNLFAAVCSALTLGLLARSVSLLPHDRTLAQRQRERSEFSLLSSRSAWLPPVFAALVCGLQLTFWEHSVAATNESLSLLVFAYVIRCLLEYRIDLRESWLTRLAFVYGLGVTNNWAMIGFFPCFLVALVWIKGATFFQIRFILRMVLCGLAGLSLYLLLPLVWAFADSAAIDFWQALKTQLANQKAFLLRPDVRSRAFLLLLTSVLPVFIMGIRWPSSFGDTSAAGAVITNLMFRVVHIVFLTACLWTVFDQQFSPRALITKRYLNAPSMLTFYYLAALTVGYMSGYVLLVFGEGRERSWRRHGHSPALMDRSFAFAVWLALIAVPAGLVFKNFKVLWDNGAPYLKQFAELCAAPLPDKPAIILSDDLNSLLMLEAHLSRRSAPDKHVLVHSRSMSIPEYHHQLVKRYPAAWPNILEGEPQGDLLDDVLLLKLMLDLSRTNEIYYLHPSFGFYFESFQARPHGLINHLNRYDTNVIVPPPMTSQEIETNQIFWTQLTQTLDRLQRLKQRDSRDAQFLSMYYSRALNDAGVAFQRAQRVAEAGRYFELATNLNTNNRPARINLEFSRRLQANAAAAPATARSPEEKLGDFRDWESMLAFNGQFDEPEYCYDVGELFLRQTLYRQAAIQFSRVQSLQPTNVMAQLGLANVYLQWRLPDQALQQLASLRESTTAASLKADTELAIARLEASAQFAKTNYAVAEKILLEAQRKHPDDLSALEALARFYAHSKQTSNAFNTIDGLLKKDPHHVSALIDQATLHFNNRAFDKAIESLDRILRQDAKNLQALLYKVLVYMEAKDYKKASAEVDRVLEIDRENYEALLHQAVILIETGADEEAIRKLGRLLQLHPNDWNALRNRAIAHLHRDQLDDARRDYEKLQRQLPRYHVPYYGLAEIAYRRKDNPSAIRNYEYYLKYAPEDSTGADLAKEKKMVRERLTELKEGGR